MNFERHLTNTMYILLKKVWETWGTAKIFFG